MALVACAMGAHAQSPSKVLTREPHLVVFKWEGYTRSGIRVFGVSPSREKARKAIDLFITKHWKTPYKLLRHTVKSEVLTEFRDGYFENFARHCPRGYHILSARDLAALDIIALEGVPAAAMYYHKTSGMTFKETEEYLYHLYYTLGPYRIHGP